MSDNIPASATNTRDNLYDELYTRQLASLGAWFLGPKAENMELFEELVMEAFQGHADFRRDYYPTDSNCITDNITKTEAYQSETKKMRDELTKLIKELKNSLPIGSFRYTSHAHCDANMAANLGYMAAILYNANNLSTLGSPVTTQFEIDVGRQLCQMLGYESNDPVPESWGHITAGGSIANIEAIWSCRNIKFYPLCVQHALLDNIELRGAKDYTIYSPSLGRKVRIVDMCLWDVLNLDIDDIVNIPADVSTLAKVSTSTYAKIVDENNLASLGWYDFMTKHGLTKQPVIIAPVSKHYSLAKTASLLGIGQRKLIGVECDTRARINIEALKTRLTQCLKEQIPVISIVATVGTTEDGAVDSIEDIVNLRREFREKGLNFAIHADAAWGGYFITMLHTPSEASLTGTDTNNSETLTIPISEYTTRQLMSMKYTDTVSVDPHKSGYCPYPAGGLCYRNGAMRGFIKGSTEVIIPSVKDISVGIWGVEGSKPGAASAGVLLSHKVIGLHKFGYGRILGQCTLGGKLCYCLWLTLAKDDDNFVCVPKTPLPDDMSLEYAVMMITNHIKDRDVSDLQKDKKAMDFLSKLGPDTPINAFAVNKKGNTDIELCNKINYEVYRLLSHSDNTQNVQKIPLMLAHSKSPLTKGMDVMQFKDRLGLSGEAVGDLDFLISTVLNPWVADKDRIDTIGTIIRMAVSNAIGKITDEPDLHRFVCSDKISDDGIVFGDHIPMFNSPAHQYQCIAKFNVTNVQDITHLQRKYDEQSMQQTHMWLPITFRSSKAVCLGDFLNTSMKEQQLVDFFVGIPSDQNKPFLTTKVKVLDIVRHRHFDMTLKSYPQHLSYFMYGEKDKAYLSHNLSRKPDFFQVVKLQEKPRDIPDISLNWE